MGIKRALIGDTVQLTWISSGNTPSAITAAVYNGSETLVDSGTMVSSGNGHYYFNHTIVNSIGFYVSEITAVLSANPYKRRTRFQAILGEVD